MSTQKRFEIGVDYEGVSSRHLQVNEEVIFSNEEASRIFMPECGSFYVTSLIIKDIATGKELDLVTDYEVFILDAKATKESGKQVCGMIVVNNPNISGILMDYQFVGGVHSSGYYILEQLMKMYPKGTSAIISFDEVLNKPDEYDPAYHTQHVSEFFKTDGLLVWLERLRQGIHNRQNKLLENMYNQASASINALYTKLDNADKKLTADLTEILKAISIQADEYILTDSAENPAIKRGYGNWVMVTNTILRGGPAGNFLIGSGSLIAMGSDQIIRNCYIWYNKQDSSVNESKVIVTSDKDIINEDENITFTLTTTNIPNDTRLEWFLEGIDDTDIQGRPTGTGAVTVQNGTASLTFKAAADRKTEGNETFILRIKDYPKAFKNFTVLDTSQDHRITALTFLSTTNQPVDPVTEDQKFKLRISTVGLIGQTIHLKWSPDVVYLNSPPPTTVDVTANVVDIALETVGNLERNLTRILETKALETANEVINDKTPKALVYILDTSQDLIANVVFLNDNDLIVTNVDEDADFKIKVRTNGGVGQKLKLTYRSNRPLSDFSGLLSEVTIGADNSATITANNIANYITATETEFLEVTVSRALDNKLLTVGNLILNDTTKNPNFIINISSSPNGVGDLATVNEGQDFYLVFKVPGWVGSVNPPLIDIVLDFTGQPSITERVTLPTRLGNVRFDGGNNIDRIEWRNGDTLAIRLSAIADKAIRGNSTVKVRWKMSLASTYTVGPSIDIIDTSRPTLNASWSSSATELTPITNLNEMQTNGGDNTCYLWLNVDGDGSTFSNLQLALSADSVVGASDLIQIYPRDLSIAKGVNTHVVRVDILADFLNEGNERLAVEIRATGFASPLATAALTIVDNSVSIPITYTRPGSTIYSNGTYSEWENVTVTINLQPLAFATTLVLTATGEDKVDGVVEGNITIPANQSSHTLTMAAKKIRHSNGNYAVGITAKRMFGAKTISPVSSLTTNFTNDRLFPSIQLFEVYSNAQGTAVATSITEGNNYWAKIVVDKPLPNMPVVIGNSINTASDAGARAGTGRFTFNDNRKVVLKPTETRGTVTTALIPFTIPLDRKTNPANLVLELAAKIDWSAANASLSVGSNYVESLTANNADQRAETKTLAIIDVSKTAAVTGYTASGPSSGESTTFNEGGWIYFNFTVQNPTMGDVFELLLNGASGVTTSRFATHQFASRDITMTNNVSQDIQFSAQFLENYVTDGVRSGSVTLKNKTTGANALTLSFTLNDTTKTPTLTAVWVNTNGQVISSVDEGQSFRLRLTTTNINPNDDTFMVRISNAVGRPLSEFEVYNIDQYADIGADGTATFNYRLKENFKVDTANSFALTATITGLPAHVNPVSIVTPTLTINDTSRNPTYSVRWLDNNSNPISQLNEGSYGELEVRARGVAVGATLSVTLSGSGITTADVIGGALTKTSTFQDIGGTGNMLSSVNWNFTNDFLTEGEETLTATVRINGVQIGTANLKIIDTSLTQSTFEAYFTSDAAGNNKISTINEGDVLYAVLETTNLVSSFNTTWATYGDTGGTDGSGVSYQPFEIMAGSITVVNGKNIVPLKAKVNYVLSQNFSSGIGFYVPSSGGQIHTPRITVVDVYKVPSFTGLIWSRNIEGTDPVTNLNPGEDINLVILTKNILPGQQFEISYPIMDGLTVADFAYGPHTGTVMTSITEYDATTGNGRKAIGFKVRTS